MIEHELTAAFEDILPEQPSTKGWAGAARRRRQGQRAWSGAASNTVTTITDDLPDEMLTLTRDGFPTGSEPLDRYEPTSSDQQIVLLSTHGDPVTLYWGEWEGATGFAWNNPERLLWYPDEDLREIITACFASVVGEVDPAEATAPSFFQWNSANYLVLRDADGELAQLYWDGTEPASIIDEPGKRAWLIPDDVRTELERYGFDFTPE